MNRSLGVFVLLGVAAAASAAVPVLFDSDMGNDVDDALALAMLHALDSRGEIRLVGVTLTKDNPWSALYTDAVNCFYGRGEVPVGRVVSGKTPEDAPMVRVPASRRRPDGRWLYPRRLQSAADAPEAVRLLRQLLAGEADGSVVVIQVGFSTNLARLLSSAGDEFSPLNGADLVAKKVKLLSLMGGNFVREQAEYNIKIDIPAAQAIFRDWPTPVVASGFEVGEALLYPAAALERHFPHAPDHPVADAYRAYLRMPYDRPTWDLTSVLYAARPGDGYFRLSPPGTVTVDAQGVTRFSPAAEGRHRYLILDPAAKDRVLEALMLLASEPRRR